uniref:Ubiquinol-cytochrome c chaperone domain-containing protein n=1 Tax=Plectus sambesii TaxID=2011161 RepID=A0A914WYI0_9BILA
MRPPLSAVFIERCTLHLRRQLCAPSKRSTPALPYSGLPLHSLRASSSIASDPATSTVKTTSKEKPAVVNTNTSFFKRLFGGDGLLAENRERQALNMLVDEAAVRVYYQCADGFDYEGLCKALNLDDVMFTWFKLTLLHIWFALVRVHRSMNEEAYLRFRDGMLTSLWDDVENRFGTIASEWKIPMAMKKKENLRLMQGVMLQSLVEYDEGFVCTDTMLAGALWRNLYTENMVDLIDLNRAVRYVRANIAHLDTLHIDSLIVDGIKEWKLPKDRATM